MVPRVWALGLYLGHVRGWKASSKAGLAHLGAAQGAPHALQEFLRVFGDKSRDGLGRHLWRDVPHLALHVEPGREGVLFLLSLLP